MAEVLLLHHAQGLTPGVLGFADRLRGAGHTVHTPDLFDGQLFGSIPEGMAHVEATGFDALVGRAVEIAEELPAELVYAGFSFGVVAAQRLAQTRPGARGALLCYSCVPAEYFGSWPDGVPVQVHGMDADPLFVEEGDLDAARALVAGREGAELFLYDGDRHLFTDSSLADFDAPAADLLMERVLGFLAAVDRAPSSGR